MSQVQHGFLGLGILGPFQSQTWWTNVAPGGVWHFWADNTTIGYYPARVRIFWVDTIRQGNLHRVEIRMFNPSPLATGFALRWSFVYN